MNVSEFRQKTDDELNEEIVNIKKEMFNLRYQRETSEGSAGLCKGKELRRDIARVKTVLRERAE